MRGFPFAWYSVSAQIVGTEAHTQQVATIKNAVDTGSAELTASTVFYKFDNHEQQTADYQKLLPATNSDENGSTTTGAIATIVTGATWKSYVNNGTSNIEDAAVSANACAYLIVTFDLEIKTSTATDIGDYKVTLTKGAGWTANDCFNVLIADDWESDNLKPLAFSGNGQNNVLQKNTNDTAGHYTFRVVIWLDGASANLPASAISTPVDIVTATASYVAG